MIDHTSAIPMWCSDASSNLILEANDAAVHFWRYSREEFVGMSSLKLLREEELPRQRELAQRDRWGETGPWRCRRGDGSEFYCTVRWQRMMREQRLCDFVFVYAAGDTVDTLEPLSTFGKPHSLRPYDPPVPKRAVAP